MRLIVLRSVLGACLLVAGQAALASTPPPTANPAAAPATAPNDLRVVGTKDDVAVNAGPVDIDKVVCKVEPDTGSRIKTTKHCMSQRQASAAGRSAAKKIDENATVVSFTD